MRLYWLATVLAVGIFSTGWAADPPKNARTIIPPNTSWKYLAGKDPQGNWTAIKHSLKGWKTGRAPLGLAYKDCRTKLNMTGKYQRVYLRFEFDGRKAKQAGALGLAIRYDDGFIAYLNGKEVARSNVKSGHGAKARGISDRPAKKLEYFPLPAASKVLVDGRNVLAIEGHNQTKNSRDFLLDPRLLAESKAVAKKPVAKPAPKNEARKPAPAPTAYTPAPRKPAAHPKGAPCGVKVVDAAIAAKWQEIGVTPAPAANDAEFMRRAYLDVVGVIPSHDEAAAFLADTTADKRAKLIDRLLKDPRYAAHWADVWSGVLVGFDNNRRFTRYRHEQKVDLAKMLAINMPYDEFARRIAAFTGDVTQNTTGSYVVKLRQQFGTRGLPLGLASKLSRAFMGIQIQCAQCHDHPFDRWTQEDFYGMASFFTQVDARKGKKQKGEKQDPYTIEDRMKDKKGKPAKPRNIPIPDTKEGIKPAFLVGGGGAKDGGRPRRIDFATHLISPDNLQFARMAVNRYWAHFFGRGIVHPVDDFNAKNRPSHKEMLETLAKDFVAHHYDVHFLIRTITGSRAYQLSSRHSRNKDDPAIERTFAAAQVRALTPEQIMRSVFRATSYDRLDRRLASNKAEDRAKAAESHLNAYHTAFGGENAEIAAFAGTTPAALLMMNGSVTGTGTRTQKGKGFAAMLEKYKTPAEKFRVLYLSTVSRPPTAAEFKRWTDHAAKAQGNAAYEDALWTLLNSSEFVLNH